MSRTWNISRRRMPLQKYFVLFPARISILTKRRPGFLRRNETKRARLASVMYNLLETVRLCTTLLIPMIPASCEKIFSQIGASHDMTTWDSAAVFGVLPTGVEVQKGEALFPLPRHEKELAELAAIQAEQLKPAAEPEKPQSSICRTSAMTTS